MLCIEMEMYCMEKKAVTIRLDLRPEKLCKNPTVKLRKTWETRGLLVQLLPDNRKVNDRYYQEQCNYTTQFV